MIGSELKTTVEMAMLELDEGQVASLEGAVEQMLEYFARMSEIDVTGVEPTTHALVGENRVRPDRIDRSVDPDTLLENAPDLEDRLVAIPNVL
jgi:aspartyl-tRNA(Asn)/glutamyl-tRNA(Gln) amidotransferase subunit C